MPSPLTPETACAGPPAVSRPQPGNKANKKAKSNDLTLKTDKIDFRNAKNTKKLSLALSFCLRDSSVMRDADLHLRRPYSGALQSSIHLRFRRAARSRGSGATALFRKLHMDIYINFSARFTLYWQREAFVKAAAASRVISAAGPRPSSLLWSFCGQRRKRSRTR